jgi:hypothetical protein
MLGSMPGEFATALDISELGGNKEKILLYIF